MKFFIFLFFKYKLFPLKKEVQFLTYHISKNDNITDNN
jgi:hypothetical protein